MHEEMEELETQLIFKYSKQMISHITSLNQSIAYQKQTIKSGLFKQLFERQAKMEDCLDQSQKQSQRLEDKQ